MPSLVMASDFDGTIYFMKRNPRISAEDIEAVGRLRENGALYGVCTGRPYRGVLDSCGGMLRFDFHILTSGAEILDGNGNCLFRQCVSRKIIEDAAARFAGYDYVIQANQRLYSPRPTSSFQERISSLDDIPGEDFVGFSLYMRSESEAESTVSQVPLLWDGTMTAYRNGPIVDIVSASCSKGKAAEFIKRHYGADTLCGIGDSHNDVPLFKAADLAFTFHGSAEDVRGEADYVVGSTAEAISIILGKQK